MLSIFFPDFYKLKRDKFNYRCVKNGKGYKWNCSACNQKNESKIWLNRSGMIVLLNIKKVNLNIEFLKV